jgi:uncharacterized membrane protein
VSGRGGPFWLSHHWPGELHRAYRLGRVHVCARCLGTYPTLVAALAWQIAIRAPLQSAFDWPAAALCAPATVDWLAGRWNPRSGGNPWRTVTGVLLGLSLGRTLYVHFRQPFPPVLVAQIILVTAAFLTAIVLHLARRSRR